MSCARFTPASQEPGRHLSSDLRAIGPKEVQSAVLLLITICAATTVTPETAQQRKDLTLRSEARHASRVTGAWPGRHAINVIMQFLCPSICIDT